ncbi:MAG: 16S rRNA (uracil(1498)-N(3))-methyltransferase [Treponema sp.]|nr:16S rRNA (uracil(1498)-N(3))-methyltransferase [Treponema sp.]
MRQFVSSVSPNSKGLLEISGKDFHYLRNVLRLSVGDMLVLSLPGGLSQESTLCKVDDGAKKLTLQVCSSQSKDDASSDSAAFSQAQKAGASRSRLVLLQFIPKPPKMELIVRQATECGVAAIVPVIGDYTQGGSEKALQKSDRFERIVREARQQSGSLVATKIFEPRKLSAALDLIDEIAPGALKAFLYERTEKTVPLAAALELEKGRRDNDACVYAVGSEGGISPSECELFLARGFKAVHFNTNILRCETAALYAAAAIQSALDN